MEPARRRSIATYLLQVAACYNVSSSHPANDLSYQLLTRQAGPPAKGAEGFRLCNAVVLIERLVSDALRAGRPL